MKTCLQRAFKRKLRNGMEFKFREELDKHNQEQRGTNLSIGFLLL